MKGSTPAGNTTRKPLQDSPPAASLWSESPTTMPEAVSPTSATGKGQGKSTKTQPIPAQSPRQHSEAQQAQGKPLQAFSERENGGKNEQKRQGGEASGKATARRVPMKPEGHRGAGGSRSPVNAKSSGQQGTLAGAGGASEMEPAVTAENLGTETASTGEQSAGIASSQVPRAPTDPRGELRRRGESYQARTRERGDVVGGDESYVVDEDASDSEELRVGGSESPALGAASNVERQGGGAMEQAGITRTIPRGRVRSRARSIEPHQRAEHRDSDAGMEGVSPDPGITGEASPDSPAGASQSPRMWLELADHSSLEWDSDAAGSPTQDAIGEELLESLLELRAATSDQHQHWQQPERVTSPLTPRTTKAFPHPGKQFGDDRKVLSCAHVSVPVNIPGLTITTKLISASEELTDTWS